MKHQVIRVHIRAVLTISVWVYLMGTHFNHLNGESKLLLLKAVRKGCSHRLALIRFVKIILLLLDQGTQLEINVSVYKLNTPSVAPMLLTVIAVKPVYLSNPRPTSRSSNAYADI